MDAKPWLVEVGRALRQVDLDAVLIGNAAAALQGAPVTTVDLIKSKKAAGRPRDVAALEILERAHEEATGPKGKTRGGGTGK